MELLSRPRHPFGDGRTSIRRTILVAGLAFTLVLVVTVLAFVGVAGSMRAELSDATGTLVQEQAIAHHLVHTVTRQLVTASSYDASRNDELLATFRAMGEDAYAAITEYLSHDLTAQQRVELEEVKDQHRFFEVAANQAFELHDAGHGVDAKAAADAMVEHARSVQDALDEFLVSREQDLTRLTDRQAEIFRYVVGGVGLAAILFIAGLLHGLRYLHRRLGRPITELAFAAHAIGQGDLDARVRAPYNDEFAEVGEAFNRMAGRLATTKDDLEARNRELREALQQLQVAQAELVQSEKMSATGRMMAGLAHELNNPLASVLGYGELLANRLREEEPPSAEEIHEEYLDPLVGAAERARKLVLNLLGFARRSESEASGIKLCQALDNVVGLRRHVFDRAGIDLVIGDIPSEYVWAEEQRLQQVFLNVLNNAMDAMGPDSEGSLEITALRDGDTVTVHFDDTGPGFSDPDRVFEPFYTTKAVGEGTGLGLSLVHQFMGNFGGGVKAENRPDGGARVSLAFHVADPAEDGDEAPAEAPEPELERTGSRILVVEDEAPLRKLQQRLLARIEADVLVARTGNEATRLLENEDVDLVVSDVRMPDGTGLDLLRWIEEHRPHLVDRFLFVTGDISDSEIAAFAEADPDRVVRKPFQMDDYLQRISGVLA